MNAPQGLSRRHFLQSTRIIREIPANEPTLDDIFGSYWAEAGT